MTIEVLAPDVREIWTFDMMLAPADGGHGAPPLARSVGQNLPMTPKG